MLYFSDSVLKTEPSTRRISRRMTLSRVVLLPMNEMRFTKNCFPSDRRIVTSTTGLIAFGPFEAFGTFGAFSFFVFAFPSDAGGVAGGVLPSVAIGASPSFFGL